MNDSIGPCWTPNRPPSQPHWKIATITPSAALMLSRFMTAACSGITSERNTIISSSARQQHDDADEQRQLVAEHRGEVDRARGHPADVHGHARVRLHRRNHAVAQAD